MDGAEGQRGLAGHGEHEVGEHRPAGEDRVDDLVRRRLRREQPLERHVGRTIDDDAHVPALRVEPDFLR